jgi:TonB family protein
LSTGRLQLVAVAVLLATASCREAPGDGASSDPVLLTRELPFVYPPALYAAGVEGDVALRLYVDSLGLVVTDSTSVAEPSTHAEFDSAAVVGAPYLEFQPAVVRGARVGKTVVLPVKFRLPSSSPPADSQRRDTLSNKR